ncbi:hypothetical protein ABFS83_04G108600 [Erythranthe nasuta]
MGVMFNRATKKITLDRSLCYGIEEERSFRVNGFSLFEDCKYVFDDKQAPAVNFEGIMGFSPNNPLVIDDENEEDYNDDPEEAEPVPVPKLRTMETMTMENMEDVMEIDESTVSFSDHLDASDDSDADGSVVAD